MLEIIVIVLVNFTHTWNNNDNRDYKQHYHDRKISAITQSYRFSCSSNV